MANAKTKSKADQADTTADDATADTTADDATAETTPRRAARNYIVLRDVHIRGREMIPAGTTIAADDPLVPLIRRDALQAPPEPPGE